MNKKLAELKVNKLVDYYDQIVNALESSGYLIVLDFETPTERNYIIAAKEDVNDNETTEYER